jgi:hypothetical protein
VSGCGYAVYQAGKAGGAFRVVGAADDGEDRVGLVEFGAGPLQYEVHDQAAEASVAVVVRLEEQNVEIPARGPAARS